MGLKDKFYDILQRELGSAAEDFVKDLKFVFRGKLVIKPKTGLMALENAYFSLTDTSTGNEIFKVGIPFDGKFEYPDEIGIPIEMKGNLVDKDA